MPSYKESTNDIETHKMERLSRDGNLSFLARNSMSVPSSQRTSHMSLIAEPHHSADSAPHLDERNWSWAYLRNRFQIDDLDELYDYYFLRFQNSYFNVYLFTQSLLSLVYIIILLVFTLGFDDIPKKHPNACDEFHFDNGHRENVSHYEVHPRPIHIRCNVDDAILLALPEIIAHALIFATCGLVLFLVSGDKLLKAEGHRTAVLFSIFTCSSKLVIDLSLSIYYYLTYKVIRTPLAFPTIIMIYFFLPFPRKLHAVIMGTVVIVAHLVVSAVLHEDDRYYDGMETVRRVFAELIFYACGNAVGLYFQMMNEVTIRRAFLDKRGYIKSTIKKKFEKDQEEQLLGSILPDHISKLVKEELRGAIHQYEEDHLHKHNRKRSNCSSDNGSSHSHNQSRRSSPISPGSGTVLHKKPFSELFVEKHENVSILFADIVNFTPLTVKLNARDLVDTLDELFGKFDAAATRSNCIRIKLLGDCYYAVSGLQGPTPDHAKNCVRFGFEMIEIIKEVRKLLKVDINMRIGVHSGNILSGLLGIYKWQFDIWSTDVTIANHMEQCGLPGLVHITQQTKSFLDSQFDSFCKPAESYSSFHKDKCLEECSIKTYFLTPPNAHMSPSIRSGIRSPARGNSLQHHNSLATSVGDPTEHLEEEALYMTDVATPKPMYIRALMNSANGAAITPRRSNSGGNGISDMPCRKTRVGSFLAGSSDVIRWREIMGQVNKKMKEAIDDMPLAKLEVYCTGKNKKYNGKVNIHVNPIVMSFDDFSSEVSYQTQPDPLFKYSLGCALFVLICIGILQLIAIPEKHSLLWVVLALGITFLILIIPFVWVARLWTGIKDPHRELDVVPLPRNAFIRLLFHSSNKITESALIRTVIYLCIALLISFLAIIDVIECNDQDIESDCKSPWYFTYTCALAILLIYSFFGIRVLKSILSIAALIAYGVTIFHYKKFVFQKQRGGSPGLSAVNQEAFPHLIYLLGISAMLHIMDRQMEYINRLDFIWKRRLTEEHKEASITHAVNTVLIHNILPTQIAKIYLDPYRTKDCYNRTHQNVSVLFASIPRFMDTFQDTGELTNNSLKGLQILNQIITEFDKALFNHVDVEKIKVIGSTFMAACGLEVQDTKRLSATLENEYTSSWKDYDKQRTTVSPLKRQRALHTLIKFASDMMVRLQSINAEKGTDFPLRAGISTGLVVAGVVGSQKPLYDIWGDTVNVASRLDSHGSPNKIQVCSYSANLLMQIRVKCKLRGTVQIKGKGNMQTYFVSTDENYKIVYDYDNFSDFGEENEAEVGRILESGTDL